MWYKYTSNTYGKDKGKGKVVPVLNQTPRHEDVSGNGDIAPRPGHFTPHPVPTGSEAGWVPETVWTRWRREEIPLLLTGVEPLSSSL